MVYIQTFKDKYDDNENEQNCTANSSLNKNCNHDYVNHINNSMNKSNTCINHYDNCIN